MKRVDLSNVKHRPEDGRLMATSFELHVCDSCESAHLDFKDADGNIFATALIPPDHFRPVGAKFIEFAGYADRLGHPAARTS